MGVYLIGLTGGIASGKSVVSSRLAEHGAVVIDADLLAREVVQPGTATLREIAARFGPGVISADGTLDRPALGAIIFADADARLELNNITHPAIGTLGAARIAKAAADNPRAIVVYDIPLLIGGTARTVGLGYQLVVVVTASEATRIERMVKLRGLSRDDAERRLLSQVSDSERLALADIVIDSNGTLADTLSAADELWETVKSRG